MLNSIKINNPYFVSFVSSICGALSVLVVSHFLSDTTPRIATVNISGIVSHFVKMEAKREISSDVLEKEAKHYGSSLNKELQQFAKEKNLILLPSEAVIAGNRDYTSVIYRRLNKKMKDDA